MEQLPHIQAPASDAGGSRDFISELVRIQFDLHAYIVVLLGGTQEAYDLLQETNRQIIRLEGQREGIVNFLAWAKRMAYFQVCTWRKKQARERLVFDDALFEQVAAAVPAEQPPANRRIHALNECMKKLPEKMRELFMARHVDNVPVRTLAEREGRSPDGVSVTLHRTRLALRACIEKRLLLERVNG
jgi:RNA polymerase sigma-70 factor (ECF subfamily)